MPQRRVNSWYGWRPDKPDQRDLYLVQAPATTPLPSKVDLRDGLPPSYDQGELGSCTANAIAAAIEFDQRKQKLKEFTPSRLFIYYNERAIEGTIGEDAGAEIRDGMKSINQLGAPAETLWKYDEAKFAKKPGKRVFADAKKHTALKYQRVSRGLATMKRCLASGFPFVFGFTCYDSFESDDVAKSGILNLPRIGENVVGGHAVLAVGYDDSQQRFIVRNSWGSDWGQNGAFTIPFDYLTNQDLADDFWKLSLVT